MTYEQAAEYLQVSQQLIKQRVRDGSIPVYSVGERTKRFLREDLDAFLLSNPAHPGEHNKEQYSEEFERFWAAYWRRVGKAAAWDEWRRLRKNGNLPDIDVLMETLEAQAPTYLDRELKYRPHARTWLHQRRWEDEDTRCKDVRLPTGDDDLSPSEKQALQD